MEVQPIAQFCLWNILLALVMEDRLLVSDLVYLVLWQTILIM